LDFRGVQSIPGWRWPVISAVPRRSHFIDTSLEWMNATKSNLALLGITSNSRLRTLSSILAMADMTSHLWMERMNFDFPFAISSWSALVPRRAPI